MTEPNWELWEQLSDLRSDVAAVRVDMSAVKSQLKPIEDEVKGLTRISQMALGTASGADFVAERAEQSADRVNKRLEILHRKDIHFDA